MAENQVLKDIPLLIQSGRRNDRKLAFQHLENVILKEIPPHTFKVICRLLQITLPRYDQKSSRLVSNYVKVLIEKQPLSVPYIVKLIVDVAEIYKNVHPTKPIAHICLCCFNWSCDVAIYIFNKATKLPDSEVRSFLESQSYLLHTIIGAESKFINQKAYAFLSRLWIKNETILTEYETQLKKLTENSYTLILLSYFIKFLVQQKDKGALARNKSLALEVFMKTIVGSKTKPPLFILENCQPILKQITHEEFKKSVLPSVQKALLRNPEIVLETVGFIISTMSLDLSQYAMDLGKSLGTQLHSKEDHCREEAIVACRCLSPQCSNSQAIEDLLQHFFNILNGSEGKLTVTAQRIGVLSGIGNLSFNTVTGATSIQNLCEIAINSFINVLKHEVHEGTITHTISMLSLWCSRLTLSVPKSLITWFEEALKLKTSTSAIRSSYILCMDSAFHGNTFHQTVDMIPVLVKIMEKAISQPSHMQIVTEGLAAFCLLLRLYSFDIETENKLRNVLNVDVEKLPFLSEKFLTTASDQTLLSVMSMIEKLVLDHGKLIVNKMSIVNRAILFILTKSYKTRQQASVKVKKVLSGYDGVNLVKSMLKEFPTFVMEQKFKNLNEDQEPTDPQNSHVVTPQILVDVLILICSGSNLEKDDIRQVCLDAVLPTHLRVIYDLDPFVWQKLLKKFNIVPEKFIASSQDELLELITSSEGNSAIQNALKTLVQIVPEDISSAIVAHSVMKLTNPSLSQVTKEEHGIFLTPDGELYDTSIIENLKDSAPANMNIKRESKLYSYKEQLEELELKKELEAKKRAKGLIKEPELTKKQLEAKEKQLEKESIIREQLKILNLSFQKEIVLLRTIIEGNAASLGIHVKTLLPVLISLFSSPLCAKDCVHLFVDLAQVLSDDLLISWGKPIAFATLRLLNPLCELCHDWTEIDLDTVIEKIVKVLHMNTCERSRNMYDDFEIATGIAIPLSAPGFAYCFSLFQQLLLTKVHDVYLMEHVLEIIIEHLNAREEDTATGRKYQDYLPLKQIIDILFKVICKTTGKIQGLAVDTLLKACVSADGSDDSIIATMDEIQVLLTALLSNVSEARLTALKGLRELEMVIPTDVEDDAENAINITRRIFIARYDPEEENRGVAENLWINLGLQKQQDLCYCLLEDIVHSEMFVRQSAAEALSVLLADFPDHVEPILKKLLDIYQEKLYLPPPVLDNLHRVVSESPPDKWEARSGIALAFGKMAPLLDLEKISLLMGFFVPDGLSDRQSTVRKHMLDAAIAVVDSHGEECLGVLLPVFEEFLDKAPKISSLDAVRQSVVILMGTLARHLDKDDSRVKPIIVKLIESLSTPSQQVQDAVANCLPPLVPAIKDEAPTLVGTLLQLLLDSDSYGERKGAAYGLAGLVKGLGILSLKQLNIMNTLTTAIQNKKNYKHREGALFAFEMLCNMLGRLFEPYVVNFLPHLLNCFGDTSQYVREATDNTAKAVMSRLSAHGVKLVLPSLIRALEEDSWRTKTGSIELLGAMAFCAPKQLSSCLPNIVPKLIEVLSDSHMKVQNAGAQALKQIGSVIRNPEIQAIVPVLLDALQDPAKKTSTCLAALLDTRFVHFIDAPSLALIMPVVERAFQDRSTETRKMSAQIIGNMYSLTDQKDLAPYLPNITPGLKQSLLDPVPEVRSVSARALGAMVKGMGEKCFEDLMPWLMQTLTSESSSVDRSGAAQGLSEVVGGLGVEKLKTFVPEIIATAERTDIAPHVKDGYIMMFIYLPMVFKKDFTPYIGQIINPILKALADENEFVRDTALRAGQRIVNMYADTAITLLLPELEMGLFDDNWRIRYSSVQLLGDLLYKISGVSGKMTTETADEDDNFGTEQSNKLILNSLGFERRNRVLAGLYMGRSDVALMVRQAALHVWKVVVTNTPRTLREILPTLFSLLLGCLASNSYDKRQVAARTLGDLVRKLGERVLPEIIPILEQGLDSNRPDQRQGVCIGLSEIMASTSREMVLTFVDSLVPTVRRALCDPLPEVRQAAATTFDSLHSTVGVRALDEILPSLLRQLNDPEQAEYTLDGLRQVMAIKSKVVLPYMVPQLTSHPVNTKALSFLSAVAGESLTKHLPKILPALLNALSSAIDTPNEQQELEYCRSVVLAVTGDLGLRTIIDHLLEASKHESVLTRRAAVALLYAYCCQSKVDISQHVPQLLRGLIRLFTDHDPKVLQLSWEALNAVTKNLNASEQLGHVADVRQAVRFAASDLKGENLLPGFCLPKGITPILPIFREAILNGSAEDKEQAARGLGEVIKLTSGDALKPSVVHITGPLIRVLGDRFPWNTKVSFLETLALLLSKVGPMLKPFLPQLQTTFVRSLSDSHRLVRLRSADALSYLILVHSRVDTLFTELHNAVKNAEDNSLKETMLHALRCIIGPAGDKMSDQIRRNIVNTVSNMLNHPDDSCRVVAAACLGSLCKFLPEDELQDAVRESLLDDDPSLDWILRHGRSVALMVALKESPERLLTNDWAPRIIKTLLVYLTADRLAIALTGVRATGYYMLHLLNTSEKIPQPILSTFVKNMNHPTNEVKQTVALTVHFLARNLLLPQYVMKAFVPHLVNGTKEKNSMVKSNSEYALVALLQLKHDSSVVQTCLSILDAGAKEALMDVIAKVLKKVASQPEPKEEDLDDTILT